MRPRGTGRRGGRVSGPIGQGQVAKFVLGPTVITGEDFESASAVINQSQLGTSDWTVTFELDGDGADRFAEATGRRRRAGTDEPDRDRRGPGGDLVAHGAVRHHRGIGEITGGFAEQEAKDLATQLNAGALPVELTRQSVRTVSPTLGEESLRQGSSPAWAVSSCCSSICSSTTGSWGSSHGSG